MHVSMHAHGRQGRTSEAVASIELSCGHHSMLVTGFAWWLKAATWLSSERRSHTRSEQSSLPDASMNVVRRFHDSTLTSAACASTASCGLLRSRVSKMRIFCTARST